MITAIQGVLAEIDVGSMVVTVGGISLKLEIPRLAAEGLPAIGAIVQIHTHLQIHDDRFNLVMRIYLQQGLSAQKQAQRSAI